MLEQKRLQDDLDKVERSQQQEAEQKASNLAKMKKELAQAETDLKDLREELFAVNQQEQWDQDTQQVETDQNQDESSQKQEVAEQQN